jgi:hypothetical protein
MLDVGGIIPIGILLALFAPIIFFCVEAFIIYFINKNIFKFNQALFQVFVANSVAIAAYAIHEIVRLGLYR